jgi:HD-GYP domain-containing protein (c-di-GMP phosphodiesterase class II)
MKARLKYRKVDISALPIDASGVMTEDLFVFLPSVERYVRFLSKGESLTAARQSALGRHADPSLYVVEGEAVETAGPELQAVVEQIQADTLSTEDLEILSVEVEAELHGIYRELVAPADATSGRVMERLESLTSRVIDLVAPEIKDIRAKLVANVRYLPLMHASAAISALAILCAHSNGISSRRSFRELALASFLMDLSLGDLPAETREKFLVDPEGLSPDLLSDLHQHPLRSYNLALERLPSLPEQIRQLILNHHELFNGRGYPRGVRSDALFPMARLLALAVDIYERLYRAHVHEVRAYGVAEVLYELLEPLVEPHLRRHSRQVLLPVLAYLDLPLSTA